MKFLRDLFGVKSIRCALGLHVYHRQPWRPEHYGMVCERCGREEILQFPNGGPQSNKPPRRNPGPLPRAETPPQQTVAPVALCADCYAEQCKEVGGEIDIYSTAPSGPCEFCGRPAVNLIPARFAHLACPLEIGSAPGLWFCRRCKKEVRERVCGLLEEETPSNTGGDWWSQIQKLCAKVGARFYGESGTIHRSTVVNIEVDIAGKPVAVWFRCQPLSFDCTVVDRARAEDMRRMYKEGASKIVLRGVVVNAEPEPLGEWETKSDAAAGA